MLPGSITFDEARDIYLISNAGVNPNSPTNTGFISKVDGEGKIVSLKWIDGGKDGVTLQSPKGMAVRGDTLYVADGNTVRKFHAVSGKALGKIAFEGASYLNDVALSPQGMLYVTDTGYRLEENKLVPRGTDCIYALDDADRPYKVKEGKELRMPNGVFADESGLYVVSFESPLVYSVSVDGVIGRKTTDLPGGKLDGLVKLPDGQLLMTSWSASSLIMGMPGGPFKTFIEGLNTPGDLAYDIKRNQIVVPLARDNALFIQPLGAPVTAGIPDAMSPIS